jgi:hypothetical protein
VVGITNTALAAFSMAFLFVLLHDGPRGNLLRAAAVSSRALCPFLYMFVLPLFLGAYSP